jgi:hypothetical protein
MKVQSKSEATAKRISKAKTQPEKPNPKVLNALSRQVISFSLQCAKLRELRAP